jgi:hypothetical protein
MLRFQPGRLVGGFGSHQGRQSKLACGPLIVERSFGPTRDNAAILGQKILTCFFRRLFLFRVTNVQAQLFVGFLLKVTIPVLQLLATIAWSTGIEGLDTVVIHEFDRTPS